MKHSLRAAVLALFSVMLCVGHEVQAKLIRITNATYNTPSCDYGRGEFMTYWDVYVYDSTRSTGLKLETDYGGGRKDTNSFAGNTTIIAWCKPSSKQYRTPGIHAMKHTVLNGSARVDSIVDYVVIDCQNNGGIPYLDLNNNCLYDASDPVVHGELQIQVDTNGVVMDTIRTNGFWNYRTNAPNNTVFHFKLLNTPPGYVKSCPASGIITYTYQTGTPVIFNQNFGFTCSATPATDFALSYGRMLRGATSTGISYVALYASNNSCQAATGTVTLNISPKYRIKGVADISPSPTSVSGNTITWTLNNMMNGAFSYLYIPLTPLSTTNNGDTARNIATITTLNDGNLTNNLIDRSDTVRSSWDPNHKSVYSPTAVKAGSTLTYTVDFENLGGDTAFNIYVLDTLSQYLDANSFSLISATHAVKPYIYQMGSDNLIKFDFENIKLGAKNDSLHNKGQVSFSMRVKAGTPLGTTVANRAGIYFDKNPVVLTNTAYSRLAIPASVASAMQANGLEIFPNPTSGALHIRASADWQEVSVYNAMGQVVTMHSLNAGSNQFSLQELPSGLYYIKVKGTAGTYTTRVLKD